MSDTKLTIWSGFLLGSKVPGEPGAFELHDNARSASGCDALSVMRHAHCLALLGVCAYGTRGVEIGLI